MKKVNKFLFAVLMSLLMIITLVSCSGDDGSIVKEENTVEGPYSGKTIILHTNDTHGALKVNPDEDAVAGLEGYATVAFVKKDFESKGATVILVDDGDYSQGSVYVSLNKGAASTDLMNQVGYDLVGLGNHEFDYGLDQLKSNFENKNYKVICANVFDGEKTIFDSNAVFKVGKVKIGFFGLLTPETQTKVNPNYVKGLTFTEKEDLYATAQKEADALAKKADIVICLGHLGTDDESIGNRSVDVYSNTNGIDFIIDGHSHTVMEKGPNGEPIQSTGSNFENIGVIVIDNATKTIENNYLLEINMFEPDSEVLSSATAVMSDIDKTYGAVFANSEVDLNGVKEKVRSQETNMGDLATDSMIWEVLKNGSIAVADDMIIAVTNGGGIRNSIAKGGVKMSDVNSVLPFGNTIAVNYITGAELLEALEASTFSTPEPAGAFPQIAGMKITIDTTKKYDEGAEYPDSTYKAPNSITRVTIDEVNGKPFDPNATYAVVTNDFLAAGGDTYYAFKKAYDAGKGFDTGVKLDEALIDYITNELNGTIGSKYAEPQERISIVVE